MEFVFNKNSSKNKAHINALTSKLQEEYTKHQSGKSQQTVFTSPELTFNMLKNIDTLNDKSVLVIANVETYLLLKGLKTDKMLNSNWKSLYFLTDNKSLKGKENIIYCDFNKIDKLNIDMKFDVVIGNPPYQRSNSKAYKLWIDFLKLSYDISKDKVAFITPSLLWKGYTKKISSLRDFYLKKTDFINLNANNYFSNIGEDICYYIISKNTTKKDICVIDKNQKTYNINKSENVIYFSSNDKLIKSIIKKVETSNHCRIEYFSDYANADGHATTKRFIASGLIKNYKDSEYKYEFVHSSNQIYYTNIPSKQKNKLKVVINFSSSYKNMFITSGVIGKQVEGIIVNNIDEANNIIDNLKKKLFLFYIQNEKSGGFNTGIYKLPKIDFSKLWSDQDLYKHFKLTQEEIDYIESSVK
jgi:hypothetical protein